MSVIEAPARPIDDSSIINPFFAAMEFFAPFVRPLHVAVAVSGGADSMALTLLAQEWAITKNGKITALTVDHMLRRESTGEALQVEKWMEAHGVEHRILAWEHRNTVPVANVQMEAREARYRLLADWCAANNVSDLLLAHHMDDQAETFMLRLARGSGVDGLSCMSPAVERHGIRLLRPLLELPKSELQHYLTDRKQQWLEDPSNKNHEFARVNMRNSMALLQECGIDAAGLVATGKRMARARDALEHYTAEALKSCGRMYEEGCARISVQGLKALPEDIALRLLSHCLCVVGGKYYRHRFYKLEALFEHISAEDDLSARTIGGCKIMTKDDYLWVIREAGKCEDKKHLICGELQHWDNRFTVEVCGEVANGLSIGALTEQGWYEVRKRGAATGSDIPKEIIYSLPALYGLEGLLMVPHIGWYADQKLRGKITLRFSPLKSLPGAYYHVLMGAI